MLEHALKLYKVLDGRFREVVDIDTMQYRFLSGRGTDDGVFILRRLIENFSAKNKKLLFIFVDLPREVIRSALRRKGVFLQRL